MFRGLAARLSTPALWFPALAVLVAGPLLLFDGYLMLLDYPAGPYLERPTLFPLPSSGDLGNATPLVAIQWIARRIHTYLPDKLFLVLPIVLGGVGIYRFARGRLGTGVWPALFGGTLFVINPFVLDRYLAGHVAFLLAYSLLPWALTAVDELLEAPSLRASLKIALWLFALGAIDVHMMGIFGVMAVVAFAAAPSARRVLLGGAAAAVTVLLSAYWLLPALLVAPGSRIGSADLAVYATRPRGGFVLPTLMGMYGFWRDEFVGPAMRVSALYLLLVPLLGLVVLGLVRLVASRRRLAVVLAASGTIALVLAAGTSFPPTAGIFRWLFEHLPFFGVYREPQKLLAVTILAYAVFGSGGLNALSTWRGIDRRAGAAAGTAAITAVLLYAFPMLWGFGGQVELSRYPAEWETARRTIDERGPGRTLIVPWHLYAVWTFSDGRIVANPARSFFQPEVLTGTEAGFEQVGPQSADPFADYVAGLLRYQDRTTRLGRFLAPIGVRYVVSLREVDYWTYDFLARQGDLRVLYEGSRLVVYENARWRKPPEGLNVGPFVASPFNLMGGGDESRVDRMLFRAPPFRPATSAPTLSLVRSLPGWQEVWPLEEKPYVTMADRCSDGWKLGDVDAECHLGVVAAFRPEPGIAPLWRPLAGIRLVGIVLSTAALAAAALLRARLGRRGLP